VVPGDVVEALTRSGTRRGDLVALVLAQSVGVGLATSEGTWALGAEDPGPAVQVVEDTLRPRWAMWSNDTAAALARGGVRLATAWDVAAVHRLLFGGWAADPACVWALLHDLALESIPTTPPDLFNRLEDEGPDPDDPVRPDGHLRPEWLAGGWAASTERLSSWAATGA
jgi:DNA polymerase-1